MRILIASYFAVAALTVVGCVAPDYGGGGGGRMMKKRGWSQSEQPEASPYSRARKLQAAAVSEGASQEQAAALAPAAPTPPPAPPQGVSGIGARLQTKDGALSIAAIIPGGPAAKDGRLQVGDVVSAVAQGDGPWAQTEGMSGSQVVALVRGDSGSIVRLKVLRGGSQTLTVSLVRASVQVVAAPADAGAPAEASAPAASSAPAPRPKPRDTTDYTDQLGP